MNNYSIYQTTIAQPVSFVGIGLHTGTRTTLTLKPCEDCSGVFFRRKDVSYEKSLIAARWYKVSDTTLSTVLTNRHGVSVSTIEHLMAALRICGIDNLEIEIDGPEVPIMDGSALPFVETIERIGIRQLQEKRKAIWVHNAIEIIDGEKYALLMPDVKSTITVSIDFSDEAIGTQTYSTDFNMQSLRKNIAPARTFGFKNQIESLRKKGLTKGGSLKNAILVDGNRIVNSEGLRFENEFVRHKVLDTIGDMALIGTPIIGHYYSYKGGHGINKMLIKKLLNNKADWSYINIDEFQHLHGDEAERITENAIKAEDNFRVAKYSYTG